MAVIEPKLGKIGTDKVITKHFFVVATVDFLWEFPGLVNAIKISTGFLNCIQ